MKNEKIYLGVKGVIATPMTQAEYQYYRGVKVTDENDREGYLIEYLGAGDANHPNHKNYISWSPKETFESAYIEIEASSKTGNLFQQIRDRVFEIIEMVNV